MQILRDQKERVVAGFLKRGFTEERIALVDQVIRLDDERKDVQTQLDSLLNERNMVSEEIGDLYKKGKAAEANQLKAKVQG
ncbi:MAG: serine--tRNA ligase, partial [Saprospiraceae bacterium]